MLEIFLLSTQTPCILGSLLESIPNDLSAKIIALKDKLENVSKELEGSNAVLSEIGKHPNGALGWASEQMSK